MNFEYQYDGRCLFCSADLQKRYYSHGREVDYYCDCTGVKKWQAAHAAVTKIEHAATRRREAIGICKQIKQLEDQLRAARKDLKKYDDL